MMDELEPQCAAIEACLPLLVGGELERPLADEARTHLGRCPRCSGSLRALEGALAPLSFERGRVDPTIDLWPGLERELIASGRIVAVAADGAEDGGGALQLAASMSPARPRRSELPAPRGSNWLRRAAFLSAAASVALLAWRVTRSDAPTAPQAPPALERGMAVAIDAAPAGPRREAPAPTLADVALVGSNSGHDASSLVRSNAPSTADERLVMGPLSAPLGASAGGLRRLGGDEPLLRDSIDSHASGGDYSLAGSRGLR